MESGISIQPAIDHPLISDFGNGIEVCAGWSEKKKIYDQKYFINKKFDWPIP